MCLSFLIHTPHSKTLGVLGRRKRSHFRVSVKNKSFCRCSISPNKIFASAYSISSFPLRFACIISILCALFLHSNLPSFDPNDYFLFHCVLCWLHIVIRVNLISQLPAGCNLLKWTRRKGGYCHSRWWWLSMFTNSKVYRKNDALHNG